MTQNHGEDNDNDGGDVTLVTTVAPTMISTNMRMMTAGTVSMAGLCVMTC